MGAERTQKGAVGQQLAASGRARRAEAIRRKGGGEGGPNIGRDISRGVMEDQMEMNDKKGKQKQGKPGRPGKPIEGRYPVRKPIEEGGRPFPPKEGRPFEPPKETYDPPRGDRPPETVPPKEGRPPSRPIRGDDQYGPGRPGRPIGDDNWATLPYFPEKPPIGGRKPYRPDPRFPGGERPPGGGRPGKPPFFEGPLPGPRPDMPGRPPVKKHPWGREDDPNYGRRKDAWHQRRKEMEMKRKEDMWRKARERKGGTDFGPGRGDRLPEGADPDSYLTPFSGQNLERPGAAATTLQDFMEQMANLRRGEIR